jgi:hypothetical protein
MTKTKITVFSTLLLSLFFLKSVCASDTIPINNSFQFVKGWHFARPVGVFNRFLWQPQSLRWRIRFDSTCRYVLRDKKGAVSNDQLDWLKLPGVTFTPWFTHGNTAMVGWRYNEKKDSFELNLYWHIRGATIFEDNPHLCVAANETFETEVSLDYEKKQISVFVHTPRGVLTDTKQYKFKRFRRWSTDIHPFFGGSVKAPHKMLLYCELIKYTKRDGSVRIDRTAGAKDKKEKNAKMVSK